MRKKKWQLRKEFTLGARLFLSGLVFVLLVCLTLPLLSVLGGDELTDLMRTTGAAWRIAASLIVALPVMLSYFLSRVLFTLLTYKRVEDSTDYCGACGYDLTGNITGRCPECGVDQRLEFADDALFHIPSRSLFWLLTCCCAWLIAPILYFTLLILMFTVFYFSFGDWVVPVSQLASCVGQIGTSAFFIRHGASRRQREWAYLLLVSSIPVAVIYVIGMFDLSVLQLMWVSLVRQVLEIFTALGFYILCVFLAKRIGSKRAAFVFWGLIFGGAILVAMFTVLLRAGVQSDDLMATFGMPLTILGWAHFLLSALGVGYLTHRVGREYRQRLRYERTGEWPTL